MVPQCYYSFVRPSVGSRNYETTERNLMTLRTNIYYHNALTHAGFRQTGFSCVWVIVLELYNQS